METLNQIVEGCKAEDRNSQRKLFEMFYGKMKTVAKRYISDNDSAQDVLNVSFFKAFSKIKYFEQGGSFEGWLRRIVINTSLDHIRKHKKKSFLEVEYEDELISEIEEINLSDSIDVTPEECLDAIQNLSPAYRMVFNLRLFEDMTHKEIAKKLDISESTSKSNYSKAKKNVQKSLMELIKRKENEN